MTEKVHLSHHLVHCAQHDVDALGPPLWLGPAAARGDKALDELLTTHMGYVCFSSLGTLQYWLENLPNYIPLLKTKIAYYTILY